MTRKDYIRLASALSRVKPIESDRQKMSVWKNVLAEIAHELVCDNGRFDKEKFYKACG